MFVAATLLCSSSYLAASTFFILTQAPSTREKTCDIGSLVSVTALLKIPLIGTTAAASVWQVSGCMSVCMYGRHPADVWHTDS